MRPLLLLLVATLLSSVACAQGIMTIPTHVVAPGAAWLFYYELDHGSTAQQITLDLSVTSQSSSGVIIRLLDTDEKYLAGSHAEAGGSLPGTGAATAQLTTDSRTGVHPLIVIVQTFTAGDTVFDGRIDYDAGTLAPKSTTQSRRIHDGLLMPFGLYAAFNGDLTTQASFTTNIVLDFGSVSHATDLRFEGVGSGLNEVRLYDVTGGDVLIKTLTATTGGNLSTSDLATTASYNGLVEFRVEVDGTGASGDVFWAVWLPDTVSVTSGSGDGVPAAASNSKNGGGGGGCVTRRDGNLAGLGLIGLLGLIALYRALKPHDAERRTRGH